MPDWTREQKQAIEETGSNLLVAAAAGSGKTAVLVERIIHKIIDEKVDIDKILVVTFTNAAASEMRERILDAIYKKIDENPLDAHLQKQITLLNKANICTIHSFCLDIIRNYFYEIDISANFQIGDSSEMEILKQETLDELFEEKYINKDERFLKLIDLYATYRGDDDLKNIILKIENQIQSNPFPDLWLKEKVEMFNLKDRLDMDFSKTIWGEILLEEAVSKLIENSLKLEKLANNLERFEELEKYEAVIWKDKELTDELISIIQSEDENKWNKLYEKAQTLKFATWPSDKKITIEYKDEAKEIRDKIKDNIKDAIKRMKLFSSEEANEVLFEMYDVLESIKDIILEFEEKFSEKKREKNKIDFHDIEHLALKILTKKEGDNIVPSDIAIELKNKFNEIAIDEYQDSNLVQEFILTSISNGNNIFMVGDMKQSIYRFRQARVQLFSDKYDTYSKVDDESENENLNTKTNGRKIQLFKNFRSREEVLDFTNWVFEEIMSRELGDVDYTEEEYLNLGADYEKNDMKFTPELHILDLNKEFEEDDYVEDNEENDSEENEQKTNEKIEKLEIIEKNEEEAKIVANRIEELINEKFNVFDKKQGTREIQYKDIAIILRTTADTAEIYERELNKRNIPVYSDTSSNYLESTEIQTIISLLKIINNPMQDIPFVSVLRSPIGDFTDNELIEIRLNEKNGFFYEAMLKARITVSEELREKINNFLDMIEEFREMEREKPLDELIWMIFEKTGYYNYVGLLSNGSLRQANLKMLFERAKQYETSSFKGLYNFINFIDRLKLSSGDLSSAKIVGENDNVVRIMSIHKSKGLEFPVVFLSGTGKQFNKRDLNESIVLHQDYGFGPKYIDSETKVSFSTLAKYALRIKLEREMISEEMRVLYVALTRAREKLIITGSVKNYAKEEKELKDVLELYKQKEGEKLNTTLIRKYTAYLKWIMLLCLKDKSQNKININIHKLENNSTKNDEKIEKKDTSKDNNKKIVDNELLEEIKEKLNWKYQYTISSTVPTKTSVSKLKEENQKELDDVINKNKEYIFDVPKFMVQNKEIITSARKGTLIHLCFQKLDKNKNYSKQDIEKLINELVEKDIILKEEAESINTNVLVNYTKSNLFKELKQAKEIHEEEPFYLEIPANRLNKEYLQDDKILVQGIIDLYYINQNDRLILVDYKTDYAEKGEEHKLIDRYKEQLNLYKEAIEKSLNRKVDRIIIYSTWIGEIEIK